MRNRTIIGIVCVVLAAAVIAAVSTSAPRAVLMRTAPGFILASRSPSST